MGAVDKAKDKVEATKGKAKKTVGRTTDDPYLEAEGTKEQVSGDLKQAGEKVKDAFRK